jgi:hypothetical protein
MLAFDLSRERNTSRRTTYSKGLYGAAKARGATRRRGSSGDGSEGEADAGSPENRRYRSVRCYPTYGSLLTNLPASSAPPSPRVGGNGGFRAQAGTKTPLVGGALVYSCPVPGLCGPGAHAIAWFQLNDLAASTPLRAA